MIEILIPSLLAFVGICILAAAFYTKNVAVEEIKLKQVEARYGTPKELAEIKAELEDLG